MKLKKKDKLTAYWDKKENCIGAYHPLGFMTQADAHYLFDKVFTKDFVKEITDRGYDVRTMKFEISPKLPNYERFNGLSEKYYGKETRKMENRIIVSVNPAVRIARSLVPPAAPVGNQKQRNHDNARRYKRGL